VAFKDLRNVRTGERRGAEVGPGRWTCGLTWCARTVDRGQVLSRRDGSDCRLLLGDAGPTIPQIALGRFVPISGRKTIQLYDLRSGRLADLGAPRKPHSFQPVGFDDRLFLVDRADGYLLVDLTAIR
jgi:hypothetical protein